MRRFLNKLIKIIVVIFLTLYGLIWVLSPVIAKSVINEHGLPDGFLLTPESTIRYNPFTSHLTVSKLEMRLANQNLALKLHVLEAELHLHQLLFDTIHIAEFKVKGLYIPAVIDDSKITIAGFDIAGDAANTKEEVEPEEKAFVYKVVIPKFSVTDAVIEVEHLGKNHRIQLNSLLLENILLSQSNQNIHLSLHSEINQAPLDIDVNTKLIQQFGVVSININVDEFALNHLQTFMPDTITDLNGKVSYSNKLDVVLSKNKAQINVDQLSLSIDDFHALQNNFAIDISNQMVKSENISLIIQPDAALDMTAKLTSAIDNISLKSLVDDEQLVNIEAIVVNDVSLALAQNSAKTTLDIENMLLSMKNFHALQAGLAVDVASQQIQSNNVSMVLLANEPATITASLGADTGNVSVKSLLNNGQLLNISGIAITDISLALADNSPNVSVGSMHVSHSLFSQHATEQVPSLASFTKLLVNNIGYEHQDHKVSIENVALSGLAANLFLDKDKQLTTLIELPSKAGDVNKSNKEGPASNNDTASPEHAKENSDTEKVEIEHSEEAIAFSLGGFSLLDGAHIEFKDNSVSPSYERNVHIDTLSLSALDTTKPDLETLFNLQGKSDKYANFVINGRGQPFAAEKKYNVNALIKEVSLPSVSSYIKDSLKFEIESGQLDLTVKAGLKGEKIKGDVNVLLRGVEFTAANDHETGTVAGQTSIPFNVALGMLKDSDGNVELSLPLAGDTSSPSFGLSGLLTLLVKQATMSAAKDYLITTFVPYASVMKVAMAAGEFALKLRINDLNYLPQQVELTTEQIEFSRQMSVMLEDREDINVKLCAIAVPEDIGLVNAKDALLEVNVERLQAISSQRVDIFKSYMVDQFKVSSAKLLRCTSQIDTTKGAKARIEFVI